MGVMPRRRGLPISPALVCFFDWNMLNKKNDWNMIRIDKNFIRAFTPNEQLIMLRLLLNADKNGVTEFSDRAISKETEIPYQKVRTIHQRLMHDGVITNAPNNAPDNAKRCFVSVCDYESYDVFNIFSNAASNAVTNALKEQEKGKETESSLPQTPTLKDKEKDKEKEENKGEANASLSSGDDAPSKNQFDYSAFLEFFNKTLDANNSIISRVRKLDQRRKNTLHARIVDYGEDAIYEVAQKAAMSKFMNGGGNKGWKASFDWIFGPDNFRKVLEGNYDDGDDAVDKTKTIQTEIDWQR